MFEERKGVTDLGQDINAFGKPNLSPEDEARHYADLLASALEATSLVEIVETKVSVGQIHMMMRVQKSNAKEYVHNVLHPILLAARGSFDLYVGTQYFIKKNTDDIVFGWVFCVGATDMSDAVRAIGNILDVTSPRVVVTEAPLMGPGTPSGSVGKAGRKGAAPISDGGA